jgi:hypothetical protein
MFISKTVQTLTQHIEGFSKQVFSSTSGFALTLLSAFASIWILYVGYNAVVKGEFNLAEVINKLILFSVLGAMLTANNALFYNYVYTPIKDTTNVLVKNVLTISPSINGQKLKSSKDATDKLEWTYSELGKFVEKVKDKAGWQQAIASVIVLGLVHFCFVMGGILYALYELANTLKLCGVGALSPLLIVGFCFSKTRGHAIGALQYLLCSALTLVISSFFVGLLLFSLRSVTNTLDINAVTSDEVTVFFHVLLAISIISIYVLLLAPGMAAAISGARSDTALTGMAAAAVTGGYAFVASKIGFGPLKTAGKLVGQASKTSIASVARNNFSQNSTPRRSP